MSNDHTYIDFLKGPADKYVWDYSVLEETLITEKVVLILDPKSFLKIKDKGFTFEILDETRDTFLVLNNIAGKIE